MKRTTLLTLFAALTLWASASTTLPIKGKVINPTDKNIQYIGRICFDNPMRPRFTFPGVQINARFTGTSLKMIAKPKSGYFMAQIDEAAPFKVGFMAEKDSVVTLATALPKGEHSIRLMYVIEGYELKPEFRGFVLDCDGTLLEAPALPDRRIEFIGNSITCGYGNESIEKTDPFEYETENHYYTYAQQTCRNLNAMAYVVAPTKVNGLRSIWMLRADGPLSIMMSIR